MFDRPTERACIIGNLHIHRLHLCKSFTPHFTFNDVLLPIVFCSKTNFSTRRTSVKWLKSSNEKKSSKKKNSGKNIAIICEWFCFRLKWSSSVNFVSNYRQRWLVHWSIARKMLLMKLNVLAINNSTVSLMFHTTKRSIIDFNSFCIFAFHFSSVARITFFTHFSFSSFAHSIIWPLIWAALRYFPHVKNSMCF